MLEKLMEKSASDKIILKRQKTNNFRIHAELFDRKQRIKEENYQQLYSNNHDYNLFANLSTYESIKLNLLSKNIFLPIIPKTKRGIPKNMQKQHKRLEIQQRLALNKNNKPQGSKLILD